MHTWSTFKRPQLWLTSNSELAKDGEVGYHPPPHPERLVGTRSRRSAPYPERLCDVIVHSFDRQLNGSGPVPENLRKTARFLLGHLFNDEEPGESPFYDELASYGAVMIDLCRHGQAAVSAERVIDESVDKLPLGASPPSISTADGAFHMLTGGRSKFERENVQRP